MTLPDMLPDPGSLSGAAPSVADGSPVLVPVLPNHRFDEAALARYLAGHLPGFAGRCVVQQFQGGQSNPTFHLETGSGRYVLRKKPPGTLLPSAHAVDREYRILHALRDSGVPVPQVHLLCTEEGVIGTIFYVMEYLGGRVFADRALPSVSPADRAAIYGDMGRVLARLHGVDWRRVGLEGFGRPGNYVGRQVERWSRQYAAARGGDEPAMDRLMAWLTAHAPATDETAIAHGDYRLGNLLIHPAEPRVVAVLDWELATLGHPLADLAYSCLAWRLPPELQGVEGLDVPGLPSEAEYVRDYCRRAGRPRVPDLEFFVAFSLFRWAAIAAGVYRRALDGNAADARGREAGGKFRRLAEYGWKTAQGA